MWYRRLDVIFEMMKYVHNREVCVINPFKKQEAIRMIKINNAQQFGAIAKWINLNRRTWNFYNSLAVYKEGIPEQTFNMEKRDNKKWNKEHWKHIKHFDFLIDLDCDAHSEVTHVKPDVTAISTLLNTIPHSIRYSGMGYHIIIPGEYMPDITFDPEAKNNYFDFLRELLVALRRKYSDFVDTGCHDPRRVCKIPYSLALYEDDNYVCYPLRTLRELDKLPINYLTGDINASGEPIRNRGIPLINFEKNVSYNAFKSLLGTKYKRFKIGI